MAKSKGKSIKSMTYEEAYAELEGIVETLEAGTLPLEESLALFERGQALSKQCGELLEKAELKLQELTEDIAGEIREIDLDLERD
jgi:exodeoxyribonuclease VII small subunit